MIAGAIVIISTVIFVFGTKAVARRDNDAMEQEHLIPTGTSHWNIVVGHGEAINCIGTVSTLIEKKKDLRLSLRSAFAFQVLTKPIAVVLKAQAYFTDLGSLDRLNGEATVGKNRITLRTVPEKPEQFALTIITGQNSRTFELPRPNPILLIERMTNRFALRTPGLALHGAGPNAAALTQFSVASLPGFQTIAVSSAEAKRCRADLEQSTPATNGDRIDIGSILTLLGVRPDDSTLKALAEQP